MLAPTRFMVASDGVLSEGYGHDGPGVDLGDGQTEAEGVESQGGRGDALLRRMPPYLTCGFVAPVFTVMVFTASCYRSTSVECLMNNGVYMVVYRSPVAYAN